MRAADGVYRWIHDTSTPVLRDDGQLDHFLGFMIDITERMQAQEGVRQAEERYRLLVERTPAITYTESIVEHYEPTSVSSYLSPQIETVLGYPIQAWESPGFWLEVIHPDDRDRSDGRERPDERHPRARTSRSTGCSPRTAARSGSTTSRSSCTTRSGNPLYWQGVMLDVTERKHAEDQLRQAEQRHRALIEHIPAVVYRESPEGDPARFYISPQVEDLFGYTPEVWTWTPELLARPDPHR